jgi:hypothetical protein
MRLLHQGKLVALRFLSIWKEALSSFIETQSISCLGYGSHLRFPSYFKSHILWILQHAWIVSHTW